LLFLDPACWFRHLILLVHRFWPATRADDYPVTDAALVTSAGARVRLSRSSPLP
jgi:hypothetical protein